MIPDGRGRCRPAAEQGLQEITYSTIEDKKNITFKATNAWLGITDKYWAAAVIPSQTGEFRANFLGIPASPGQHPKGLQGVVCFEKRKSRHRRGTPSHHRAT